MELLIVLSIIIGVVLWDKNKLRIGNNNKSQKFADDQRERGKKYGNN